MSTYNRAYWKACKSGTKDSATFKPASYRGSWLPAVGETFYARDAMTGKLHCCNPFVATSRDSYRVLAVDRDGGTWIFRFRAWAFEPVGSKTAS